MSGTTISNLPAAGSVGLTDLFAKVALGSPNVTQRATITQLIAAFSGQTVPGVLSFSNGISGTEGVNFSQFNPSAASPGYIRLPGGVTIQWGSGTTAGTGEADFNFPTSFSSNPWVILATTFSLIPANAAVINVFNYTNIAASITGHQASGAAIIVQFFWAAIGPT